MKRAISASLLLAAACSMAAPAFAQSDPAALEKALYAAGVDVVVAEGWSVCAEVLEGNDIVLDALEDEGWTISRHYLDTLDPFYLDLDGSREIEGMGTVELYAGAELYPDLDLAYCTFSILNPQRDVSISGLDTVFVDAMIESGAEGTFASWRHGVDDYLLLGRIYLDEFELLVQVTLLDDFR